MPSVLAGLLGLLPVLTVQNEPEPLDRFAGEPDRPKAESPIAFGKSWEPARAEAKRTDQRILAVFN